MAELWADNFAFSSLRMRDETAVGAVISSTTAAMCFSGHVTDSWDETRGKKSLHYCKFLGILISGLNIKYYFVAYL